MAKQKTVLVTGANGFIGSNTVRRLLDQGLDVLAAVYSSKPEMPDVLRLVDERARITYLDISKPQSVAQAFRNTEVDYVIHLAAVIGISAMEGSDLETNVNVVGTRNLIEGAKRAGVGRFIFLSSNAVYGSPDPADLPLAETAPTHPANVYGMSKLRAEQELLASGLEAVVFRGPSIYGPGPAHGGPVPSFFEAIRNGVGPTINGNGEPIRDFVYVQDVADAFILGMEGELGVYNLGTSKGVSLKSLWNTIAAASSAYVTSMPEPTFNAALRPGEIQAIYLSADKIRQEMGWVPRTSLVDGIQATADYFFAR